MAEVELYVVPEGGVPLLGREWLTHFRLDWPELAILNRVDAVPESLQQLLSEYQEVFTPSLGKLRGTQVQFDLKPGSNPVFHKARSVPYALKPRIEAELKRLEEVGIIEKVNSSDWASPTIFQRTMDQLLGHIEGVQCFLDDILITARDDAMHLKTIGIVLAKLQEVGLTVKKEKCEFFKESVEYLSHRVDTKGLHMTKGKVKVILEAPPPGDVSELKSFLGLVHYYGRFCPNLSHTLAPLTELLRKDQKWTWS